MTDKVRFIINVPVTKVEKIGDLWYAHFQGSWESLALGTEKPFEVGDMVKITFEKVENDQPSQPSE